MKYILLPFLLLISVAFAPPAEAASLIEYHMSLPASENGAKRVALTFDACTGKVDERVLNALVENKIKATIFVTARWLKRNPQAIETLKANADLFEIENHGAKHLPAVDVPMSIYGLRGAGSKEAIRTEIAGGEAAIKAAFGTSPQWYRGAAAIYTASSLEFIRTLSFRLGGFSISGDGGATWSAAHSAVAIASAKDGDIVIAHINQPARPAGAGVVEGILKLKDEGFSFVTLDEGFDIHIPPSPPAPQKGVMSVPGSKQSPALFIHARSETRRL